MTRHRQVALVAHDLDAVVPPTHPPAPSGYHFGQICEQLGLTVSFTDPGVAAFGLRNALMMIGDQMEKWSRPHTTARRRPAAEGRGGDGGGHMMLNELDDLDEREAHQLRQLACASAVSPSASCDRRWRSRLAYGQGMTILMPTTKFL